VHFSVITPTLARTPSVRGTLRIVLTLVCIALDASAEARTEEAVSGASPAFSTNSSSWEGLSEFVRLAETRIGADRVKVRAKLDFDTLEPNDAVLILHPEVTLDGEALTGFLAAGGRVAIVDDFGTAPDFLEGFNVRRIPAPLNPVLVVDHNPNLAIAVPVSHEVNGFARSRHPMTEQVDLVVTNHATAFSHPALTPILEIEGATGATLPIAVTGVIQKNGRLVAVGDPSIFINLMLRYPGNRAFATGLVDYLQAGEGVQRRGRLFIVSGRFSQSGSYGEPSARDELLSRLRTVTAALSQVDQEGLPPHLALFLAVLAALWLVRFEIYEQLKGAAVVLPSFARAPSLVGQSGLLGRAELLAAPTTTPLLGVLELSAALEESVGEQLGEPAPSDPAELGRRLTLVGLGEGEASAAVRLLVELRGYQRLVGEGKRVRSSERELKRIHGEVKSMLGVMKRSSRRPEA